MKKRKILNLLKTMIGVFVVFSMSSVQAATNSSFGVTSLSRDALKEVVSNNTKLYAMQSIDDTLNISKTRQSGDYYSWNDNTLSYGNNVWKIATGSSGTRDYSDLYYCLNIAKGFGYDSSTGMTEGSEATYDESYDMKDSNDQATITSKAGGNLGTNYNKVLWILEHSYMPDESNYNTLMSNAGIDVRGDELDLTEEEIEVIQQLAIWHFTNDASVLGYDECPMIYVNGRQMSEAYSGTDEYGQQMDGRIKYENAQKLYNYFVNNASSSYTSQEPTLTLGKSGASVTEEDDYYIAGPFTLTGTNTSLIEEITPYANVPYTLLNGNKAEVDGFEDVIGGNFYLKLAKDYFDVGDNEVVISLGYTYPTRTLTFKTNTRGDNQPVVLVKNENVTKNTETDINIPVQPDANPDLALRKFITKIGDNTVESREPQITAEELQKLGNENATFDNGTTAEKDHSKTALEVKTGDLVTYTIRIYNEGNVNAYASEITDYIPAGLEFVPDNTTNQSYRWEMYDASGNITTNASDAKYIKTTYLSLDNPAKLLTAYNPETMSALSYQDVEVVCKVVAESKEGNNLRNVAAVTGMTDEEGNTLEDRDSQATNVNPDNYNPEAAARGKGEQDDDDYEDLYIKEIKADLALRKYITSIGGNEIQSSDENYRVPQIDTAKLEDESETTARYVHKKNPIEVNTGDKVIYNITVYNEGKADGRASKITDQLPTGLKFERVVSGDYEETSYNESTNRLVLTKKGSDNLAAYPGNGTPASETVQIECTVTATPGTTQKILTNIAWISEMKNQNNKVFESDVDSETTTNPNYNKDNMSNYEGNGNDNGYYKGQQDDDDFDRLVIKPEAALDLALRKFITKLNGDDVTTNVEPRVDTSTIATTGTATYRHDKTPVAVKVGDIVTYTIRVYNEGEINGYVSEITDHLPEWLDFLPNDEVNMKYLWEQDTQDARTIRTRVATKDSATGEEIYGNRESKQLLLAYNGGATLDYIDVEIRCKVNEKAKVNQLITNIADITGMQKEDGTEVTTDRDSTKDNVTLPADSDLPNYKGKESNKEDLTDDNYYYQGQEDDDDFAKLIIKNFDLALKKFAIVLNNDDIVDSTGRYIKEPVVDTSKLGTKDASGNVITDATYTINKDALRVNKGDIVTYKIRVYNEGDLDGYANQVIDYIPEGLKFIEASSINKEYGWTVEGNNIVTTYLSDTDSNNVIKAVSTDENGNKVLDYKDLQVQFEVVADPTEYAGKRITNWAEIKDDSNNDIDSTPGNNNKGEDDIDYDPLQLGYFDLALRKFITKVNNTEYNNRVPKVDISKLGTTDANGKLITTATYTHTKEPILLQNGSTVVYTLRIYNEGTIDGYANEITDNIPEDLVYLPENEVNKQYKWTMLDANGQATTDVKKAAKITTTYLSEQNGSNNKISAYQKGEGVTALDYKDIKVAFKVSDKAKSNKVIVNTAEISKASDKDIDSTPGNNKDGEDDIDKEYVKVQIFDLALKKWVTATKVTYNGKTKTTKTGFNENSTGMAKVDLESKKLKKTTVKFVYKIKVINEGEVAGYAYEIKDYVPSGLRFIATDNPKWKLQSDGTVTTDQLKNKLLKPGESAEIEIVLTWKKSTSNLGVKTNWAEISKDSGDDIDSTPDNYNKLEDDIDDAKVILSIKTGSVKTYIFLATTSVSILAAGAYLIKRKVLI